MKMSNNPAKYEVLIKQYLRSISEKSALRRNCKQQLKPVTVTVNYGGKRLESVTVTVNYGGKRLESVADTGHYGGKSTGICD